MSIKVNSSIEKLNPNDTYKIINKDDVTGIDSIEQSINTLNLTVQTLESDIHQKLSGLHVEDKHNKAYEDINSIILGDNLFIEDQHQQAVVINAELGIGLTNGQQDSSTFVDNIETIEFPNATITTRNNGKIGIVSLPDSKGINGIVVSEDNSTYVGIETLELENMEVVKKSDDTLHIKPLIEVSEIEGSYGQWFVNTLTARYPIKLLPRRDSPDKPITEVQFDLAHDVFEPIHAPSYLAYIKDDTEVIGKIKDEAKGHIKGTLFFEDVVVGNNPFIVVDRDNKAYGIQESDKLDPNVSGGVNYIVIFRINMKGSAPEDGVVRIYLAKRAYNNLQSDGYLTDTNGQPMVVERSYKAGEALGTLEVAGIVNAKAIVEFTAHVVDSFDSDNVVVTDRVEGCSGLMIQALTSSYKTGSALLQFENDTQQDIKVSSHYLGSDRMNIDWLVRNADAVSDIPANVDVNYGDGLVLHTFSKAKIGKMDNHLHFSDDGDPLDFYFGKVFSAEETYLLRGKSVTASVTLIDKDNAFRVAMVKWTGQPDNFNTPIYTSRNNGSLIFNNNWSLAGDMFISEDAISGDHTQSKSFNVPNDAVNYGFIIYPEVVEQPSKLQLKTFNVDVDNSFVGNMLSGVNQNNTSHFAYSEQHKRFVQDRQGYGALRYTINNSEIPMPIGKIKDGLADIVIDTRYNKVVGSQATGGEGCIKFINDGQATVSTTLRVYSEKSSNVNSVIKFYYVRVDDNGVMTKIPASERTINITGNSKNVIVSLPSFDLNVKANDMIALRALGDSSDAAYIECNDDSKPMLDTTIVFNEYVTPVIINNNYEQKTIEDKRVIKFNNNTATSLTYDLILPVGAIIENITVMNTANNNVTKVSTASFQYDVANKKLKVSLGSVIKDGFVCITLWK